MYEINGLYNKYDVLLQPILWELESKEFSEVRKQDEYNEKLLNSDIVIFIFGSRVGSYTKEEFNIAVLNKRKGKKPKHILTYFRNIHLETVELNETILENLNGIFKIKKYIEKDLNQVHASFSNIMDLELQVGDEVNRVVTELIFSRNQFRTVNQQHNILMLSRMRIHEKYSVDSRLHISDGLYTEIRQVRIMNLASNFILAPNVINRAHQNDGIRISDAIEKIMENEMAIFDMILTEPNEYNLKDISTKIACETAGSSENQLYSSLNSLREKLCSNTIYKQMLNANQFVLYLMKISMPYAIFNVEFSSMHKEFNHVKVDLYSAVINNENNRRSFIVWQKDDPENYNFFVENFDSIKLNKDVCIKVDNLDLLKK